MEQIDPPAYGRSRNYLDGTVTYLSPYLSRGVLSTDQVVQSIKAKGFKWEESEKLIQELAWRDYFQLVWARKKKLIEQDLLREQAPVLHHEIPQAIVNAETGISAIDQGIQTLYKTGYLHNHLRMYIASICCNLAHSHWHHPAKWLYYQLLDGDLASNHLSWQWVSGTFSKKKYYANQENINRFCNTDQKDTFLDCSYEELPEREIPEALKPTVKFDLKTTLPEFPLPSLTNEKTLIYNYYNLDPYWEEKESVQRILLLEPSHFNLYPVANRNIEWVIEFAQKNLAGIKIVVGEFAVLQQSIDITKLFFKSHPLSSHYLGNAVSRTWLTPVEGDFPSFFAYWKKAKKWLQKEY